MKVKCERKLTWAWADTSLMVKLSMPPTSAAETRRRSSLRAHERVDYSNDSVLRQIYHIQHSLAKERGEHSRKRKHQRASKKDRKRVPRIVFTPEIPVVPRALPEVYEVEEVLAKRRNGQVRFEARA